ncbi:recombinase family protein [Peribacillus frigoritolerans]|uniref:recombinase family protein n=1 Tax=Peribacillus frigoritolerans TaxID=450367 RepID=UPI002E22DCF2|nr:recombinase family protein [Peribacillus frigoritolerans]
MLTLKSKKLAVASIRRSSTNQKGNNSFEVQKLAIQDLAKKKGYLLPDEFIFYDDAVSAFKVKASKRDGLNKMKRIILTEDIGAVIFYDFSRIDRKIYSFVSEFYYDVINKKPNLKFFTTTKEEAWTPADLDVKLQLIIANAESNEKSRRAVDSQKTDLNLKVVKRPGSTSPFGYKHNKERKQLVPNKDEEIVLFIFYLASWGHSVQKVADILNEAEIPSPSKKKWQASTIDNMLKNPVYLGHLDWNIKGEQIFEERTHEPIVPSSLIRLIEINRSLKKKYNKFETPFLFGNLLYCENCEYRLKHRNSSTKKKGIKYAYLKYYCTNCPFEIEAESLNHLLINYIQKQLAVSFKINSSTVTSSLLNYSDTLKDFLVQLKAQEKLRQENQKSQIEKGLKLDSVFRNVEKRIQKQIHNVNLTIQDIENLLEPDNIDIFLHNFEQLNLNELSHTELRLVFLYFIESIRINDRMGTDLKFNVLFKVNPVVLLENTIG